MNPQPTIYVKEEDIKEDEKYTLLLDDFEARMLEFFLEEREKGNLVYLDKAANRLYLFEVKCIKKLERDVFEQGNMSLTGGASVKPRHEYVFKYGEGDTSKHILLDSVDYGAG